jgi:hypothetical protein
MVIEVSPGDAIDRLTILELKLERIVEPEKREFALREHKMISAALAGAGLPAIEGLQESLKLVNAALWDVEDCLRDHERRQDFGATFVAAARSVYRHNDRRAALKQEINAKTGSQLNDVKSYAAY